MSADRASALADREEDRREDEENAPISVSRAVEMFITGAALGAAGALGVGGAPRVAARAAAETFVIVTRRSASAPVTARLALR